MQLKITREWEIRDRSGVVVRRLPEKECNSYVIAFLDMLYVQCTNNSTTIKAPDGSTNAVTRWINTFDVMAAGTADYGLLVGTGTTAVALTDYSLESVITSGTAAGQLVFSTPTSQSVATSGSTRRFRLLRTFTNNSGSSITVRETGIVALGAISVRFCIERSLESPGVAISDGQGGSLTYTIGITV